MIPSSQRSATYRAKQAARVKAMREALARALGEMKRGDFSTGYCCCGSPVEGHGYGDGHSPVDDGDYSASGTIKMIEQALAPQGEK